MRSLFAVRSLPMLSTILLLCLTVDPQTSRPTSEEMYAYEQARARAGRDATAHVRLALWCEQHGLSSRRLEHLALALMADPGNAAARGLMGLVRDANAWRKPEQVAQRMKSDAEGAALAEYNARRDRTPMTADAQWDLALWCEQHGLKPEATAHLMAVVRLDPSRESAWKRLGCREFKGRWLNEEQIQAVIAESEAQEKADRHWRPHLARLRDDLRNPRKRAQAETDLAALTDPRAVPSVWKVFALGGADEQRRASQILAQIDGPAASKALATIAVFARSDEARRAAAESLPWRDPREFMSLLIQHVRKKIDYEVKHVAGPGSPGELFVAGEKLNLHRVYSSPNPADIARPGDFLLGYDALGRPIAGRVVGFNDQTLLPNRDALGWNGPDLSGLPEFLANSPLGATGQQAAQQAVASLRSGVAQERQRVPTAANEGAWDGNSLLCTGTSHHRRGPGRCDGPGGPTGRGFLRAASPNRHRRPRPHERRDQPDQRARHSRSSKPSPARISATTRKPGLAGGPTIKAMPTREAPLLPRRSSRSSRPPTNPPPSRSSLRSGRPSDYARLVTLASRRGPPSAPARARSRSSRSRSATRSSPRTSPAAP